jgi:hypothetical protein
MCQDGDNGSEANEDWPEWSHADDCACTLALSRVSGMPKHLRDKANLIVLQGWFDDSGKEGWPLPKTSPAYLLAGYVAPVRVWARFADAWYKELEQPPHLNYLHAGEAYGFDGEFGPESLWTKTWGYHNNAARDERLLKFAQIIEDHMQPLWSTYETPDRFRLTWLVSWDQYNSFKTTMMPYFTRAEQKAIKNPYYLSFQYIMGACLKYKKKTRDRDETIQILFDQDIDDRRRLKRGFDEWVKAVKLTDAYLLNQLVNKEPEFRDDKRHPELQAADLLAYHVRKLVMTATVRDYSYEQSPIWKLLNSRNTKGLDVRYDANQWRQLVGRVTQPFSLWLLNPNYV